MKRIIKMTILFGFLIGLMSCQYFSGVTYVTNPEIDGSIIKYTELIDVVGGTYNQKSSDGVPMNFDHTISSFKIGKYEVTYELWYIVKEAAIQNGYIFTNQQREGSHGADGLAPTESGKYEPVTMFSWREAIVWCNAYSQIVGLTPVYTYNGNIIKDSSNATACDNAVCNWSANGFRLPSEGEWQYAASNRGATPYNYASGATTYYNDTNDINPANGVVDGKDANDLVAVYNQYWNGSSWLLTGVAKTAKVGTKAPNALGLYDMSGNLWEWCWDWQVIWPVSAQTNYRGPSSGTYRIRRGGSWAAAAMALPVGHVGSTMPHTREPHGLRVSRSN